MMFNFKDYFYRTTINVPKSSLGDEIFNKNNQVEDFSLDTILFECMEGFNRFGHYTFNTKSCDIEKFNKIGKKMFSLAKASGGEFIYIVNYYNGEFELTVKLAYTSFEKFSEKEDFASIIKNSDRSLIRGKKDGKFYISTKLFPLGYLR